MKKSNLNKIIFKYKAKKLVLDLIYLGIVFIFAYFYNKLFEALSFILIYTIIRCEFSKQVHGTDFTKSAHKGIKYCRIITFIVQIISIIFIINIDLSKYINIILAMSLGILNFFAKDYLQYKMYKMVFYKGMKESEIPKEIQGIEYVIIHNYYVKRDKLDKIAFELGYSVDNIKKIKSKIVKRYS